jgi:hypothetical protein
VINSPASTASTCLGECTHCFWLHPAPADVQHRLQLLLIWREASMLLLHATAMLVVTLASCRIVSVRSVCLELPCKHTSTKACPDSQRPAYYCAYKQPGTSRHAENCGTEKAATWRVKGIHAPAELLLRSNLPCHRQSPLHSLGLVQVLDCTINTHG